MSTRGCVAVIQEGKGEGTNDYGISWRGVYNHYDSYPDGLGAEVHAFMSAVPPADLPNVLQAMLQHNDWRDFLAGGVCEYCGKKGQPLSSNSFFPDAAGMYHKHTTDEPIEDQHVTSESPDPLFIEWVYVIDPLARVIHVLSHLSAADVNGLYNKSGPIYRSHFSGWDYGHCAYKHMLVGSYSLDEPFDSEGIDKASRLKLLATGQYTREELGLDEE